MGYNQGEIRGILTKPALDSLLKHRPAVVRVLGETAEVPDASAENPSGGPPPSLLVERLHREGKIDDERAIELLEQAKRFEDKSAPASEPAPPARVMNGDELSRLLR
jgi:hypothetical protein